MKSTAVSGRGRKVSTMAPPVTRSQEEGASVERGLDQEEKLAIAAAAIEQLNKESASEPSPECSSSQLKAAESRLIAAEEAHNRWSNEAVVMGEDYLELETLWAGALEDQLQAVEDVMVGLAEREERMSKNFDALMAAMTKSMRPRRPGRDISLE